MQNAINFGLRFLVIATIAVVVYIFFTPTENKIDPFSNAISSERFINDYDIFFINPSKDSTYITGTFKEKNKVVMIEGKIKSFAPKKITIFDIEFTYYSKENKQVGKESLTIQKECLPKSTISFKKEGMTIPDETKEIRIELK